MSYCAAFTGLALIYRILYDVEVNERLVTGIFELLDIGELSVADYQGSLTGSRGCQ